MALVTSMTDRLFGLPADDWAGPKSLRDRFSNESDRLAFVIARPDAVFQGHATGLVDRLGEHGFVLLDALTVNPHPRVLEELYRYTQVRLMEAGNRPMWWFTPRYYDLAPAVAMVFCYSDPSRVASEVLSDLKGPSNPALSVPGQIRFDFASQNMVMCVIHSSDSSLNMLREASLFFGVDRLHEVLETVADNSISPFSSAQIEMSLRQHDLPLSGQKNFHQVLADLQCQILDRVASSDGERHADAFNDAAKSLRSLSASALAQPSYEDRTKSLLEFWSAGSGAHVIAAIPHTDSPDIMFLLWSSQLRNTVTALMDQVLEHLEGDGYSFSSWERAILETGFGFHDWVSQKFKPTTDDASIALRDLQ